MLFRNRTAGVLICCLAVISAAYLSDHPKVQHLGLGNEESVELKIVWPNGESTEHSGLGANRLHVIPQSDS